MNEQDTDADFRLDLSDAGDELEDLPPPRPAPSSAPNPKDPAPGGPDDVDPPPSPPPPSAAPSMGAGEGELQEIEIELPADAAAYVEQLKKQFEDAVAARQRALADFRNFQRRSIENEQRAVANGARRVIQSLLPVLDHFDMALNADPKTATIDTLLNGVRIVRDEIGKVLQLQGVEIIAPKPGDEFDPNQHEAMLREPAKGVPPNGVVKLFQPGYRLGDMVLRPAKVAIAPEEE